MISEFRNEFRFLSNFYPAITVYDCLQYPSSEHAYQAAKTTDIRMRKHIQKLPTAGEAKKQGKNVDLRTDWEEIKISVMRELLYSKFSDPVLMQKLLYTKPHELQEGNYWGDTFWGVDLHGRGCNWLGKLLMEIRDEKI